MSIYKKIISAHRKKQAQLAVLIDPDKFNLQIVELANKCNVNYFFVGGSVLKKGNIEKTISIIKQYSKIPVIIFPGDEKQISAKADAILFLSLLSGRNPDYLIGKQVVAAPIIKQKKLECISTAYILIDGNNTSTTQKVSKTKPLKDVKNIINTAVAGELLGFKVIYLEAGSGARKSIHTSVVKRVKENVSVPLIVGGGIDSDIKAKQAIHAGADIIVVGNALEKNHLLLNTLSLLFKQNQSNI